MAQKGNQITEVCSDCGVAANYLTCWKKYGKPPIKPCYDVSTTYLGTCDFCQQKRRVTSVRDYFHPDFEILRMAIKVHARYVPKKAVV